MSMNGRVSAMEEYIEAEVERRLAEELKDALDELERSLPRGRFVEVASILAGHGPATEREEA
jgi:hypothetical protein